MKNILLFTLLSTFALAAPAQHLSITQARFLNYGKGLSENLINSKSVVFVHADLIKRKDNSIETWESLVEKIHPELQSMGLDVFGYYNLQDATAGHDMQAHLAQVFSKNGVKNIIMISDIYENQGKGDEIFITIITAFNGKEDYITHKQNGFISKSSSLGAAMKSIDKGVSKLSGGGSMGDKPTISPELKMIKGKRLENFPDLSGQTLYVHQFSTIDLPVDKPGGPANDLAAMKIKRNNVDVKSKNGLKTREFNTYPSITKRFIESGKEPATAKYVLTYIQTQAFGVQEALGYEKEDDISVYKARNGAITMTSMHGSDHVYKYYIKDLITGDIYLGTAFDCDPNWQDALRNYLFNMKQAKK